MAYPAFLRCRPVSSLSAVAAPSVACLTLPRFQQNVLQENSESQNATICQEDKGVLKTQEATALNVIPASEQIKAERHSGNKPDCPNTFLNQMQPIPVSTEKPDRNKPVQLPPGEKAPFVAMHASVAKQLLFQPAEQRAAGNSKPERGGTRRLVEKTREAFLLQMAVDTRKAGAFPTLCQKRVAVLNQTAIKCRS